MLVVGSAADIGGRLRAALPLHWFADDAPVLGAVLSGFGAVWARIYDMLQTVRRQSRIGTADGAMLDMIAGDFFGTRLVRRAGQGDAAFRAAILRELLRERATRAGLVGALSDLTGNAPRIFEPSRPADTGAWGRAWGYGVAGGWGSLALPFQCFVQVRRPSGQGIAGVAGYEALRADGLLSARAVCTRTTAGWYIDATGALSRAEAGVARIDWSSGVGRLLVEGASVNAVRNPRGEGSALGTLGSGGALPTNWGRYATNGLAFAVVGAGSDSGVPYCDIRWWGTATGTATATVFFDSSTQIAALAGQTWTASVYVKLLAGSTASANNPLALNLIEYSAAGGFVTGSGVQIAPSSAALVGQRFAYTRLLNGGSTAAVMAQITATFPAGAAVDFTLRVGLPQIEQAASASSPILPPAGSPAAAARSAETVSITANLPGGYGAGAIEWASLAMVQGQVTDADIYDAAARSMPAAAIAWTAISS